MNVYNLIKIKEYEHKFDDVDALRSLSRIICTQLLNRMQNESYPSLDDKLTQLGLLWASLVPDPSRHDDEEARRIIRKEQEQVIFVGNTLLDTLESKAFSETSDKQTYNRYRDFGNTLAAVLRICNRLQEADNVVLRVSLNKGKSKEL